MRRPSSSSIEPAREVEVRYFQNNASWVLYIAIVVMLLVLVDVILSSLILYRAYQLRT